MHTDLGVHVGVTGHRPGRLVDSAIADLRGRVRDVITTIVTASPNARVTVLSPLAEGADRIVALEALAAGCELSCPLPFSQDEYLRDFATAASRAEFHALLGRAKEVIELPGTRATPQGTEAAYAAVGGYIVGASDLLIAIWDGGSAHGSGGTADVVAAAVVSRVPVVWIGALAPHRMRLLIDGGAERHEDGTLDNLAQLVAQGYPAATPQRSDLWCRSVMP